ncbi:MAG: uroporphyrinogen-III synthase [Paracoccaceae bacterium]
MAPILDEAGIAHMNWPLSRIETLDNRIKVPGDSQALLFTSANGVRAFAGHSPMRDLPVLCVGRRTEDVARQAGFKAVTCAGGTVAELQAALPTLPHRRLYYARGEDVSADLAHGLPKDFAVHEQVVYAAKVGDPPESFVADALASGRIAAISIWSRRNGRFLADYLETSSKVKVTAINLVAISKNAAEPLGNSGFRRIFVAKVPDAGGMVAAFFAALRQEF